MYIFFGGGGGWAVMKLWILGGGGHRKTGLFLGVISIHSMTFCYGQGTALEYFGGLLTFNYFECMPDTSDIFLFFFGGGGVNSRCWVQVYVSRINESIPHWGRKKTVRSPSPPPLFQG